MASINLECMEVVINYDAYFDRDENITIIFLHWLLNDKTDFILKPVYWIMMITIHDELKLNQNTRSSETHKEINPRRVRSLSLRRLSSRNSVASMEEGGASHANSVKQSRADELGCCSKCNKRFPNLSRVSGSSDFLCSACR